MISASILFPNRMSDQEKNTLWQAETHNPEICEKIRTALRDVRDPEIGMDIIQLGLVRNVHIEKNKVSIEMILTTPYCPYEPAIMESARKTVENALGMSVKIEYGKEVWDQSMMEEGSGLEWGLY